MKMSRAFALLMVDESPVGLRYLEGMITAGFAPKVVIISYEPKLSRMSVDTVRERTNDTFLWKPLAEIVAQNHIPVYYTTNHNSPLTIELLKEQEIDIAVLGGTSIIRRPTLDAPRLGVINVHPGLLPAYKGCSAVEWSVYNNDQVGVCCHFVTEKIDDGPIICNVPVTVARGDRYADVRRKAYEGQVTGLLRGLELVSRADFKDHLIENADGTYYKSMPPETLVQIKKMLETENYACYEKV